MEIKTVLFDVDGLIFDNKGLYKVSWQNEAREQGFELDDDIYQAFIEGQHAEYERWVAARAGERLDLESAAESQNRDYYSRQAKGGGGQFGFDPLLGY